MTPDGLGAGPRGIGALLDEAMARPLMTLLVAVALVLVAAATAATAYFLLPPSTSPTSCRRGARGDGDAPSGRTCNGALPHSSPGLTSL